MARLLSLTELVDRDSISEVDSILQGCRGARMPSLKDRHGRLPEASGRKWRSRAAHITPKPRRCATIATSIAIVKPARTTSDRRLAMCRIRVDTCAAFAWANTSCSKTL